MDSLIARSSDGITVSSRNLNPIVQSVTWLLLAFVTLMVCFRFLTRCFLKETRKFGLEDVFMILAFTFGLCQSATLLTRQASALGKEFEDISRGELEAALKAEYAGDILFIAALCFAKVSVCASILSLSPDEWHRRSSYALAAVVFLWATSSILGVAFQCGIYGSWVSDTSQCFHRLSFMRYIAATNAATDVALILLPAWMILPMNMPMKARLLIMSFFGTRILVVAATFLQIFYLPRLYEPNFTRRVCPYFITVQIVQFTSISTACFTYFWPFMRSLRSGLMWANQTTFTTQYVLSRLTSATRSSFKTNSANSADNT